MRFSEIIGQQNIIKFLKNNIDSGRIAHAQLFEGSTGYGALALSLAYVQYLNCKNKTDGDSCAICPSCKQIASLQHPDVHFVFPVNKSDKAVNLSKSTPIVSDNLIDSWRKYLTQILPSLYISQAGWYDFIELSSKTLKPLINKKEADMIIQKLTLKPVESNYTTIIIWIPEKMNEAAANTLLKQFEEPVANALFLFVTEDSSKIIKTILSRTQSTIIPPIQKEYIQEYLRDNYPEKDEQEIELISRISEGSLQKAIEYISNDETKIDESFESFKTLMRFCYQNKHIHLLGWVNDFAELTKEQMNLFFISSIELLRYSYMENIGLGILNLAFREKRDFINKFFPFITAKNIEQLISELEKAAFHISRNGNIKIVMTHFALSITKLINPTK